MLDPQIRSCLVKTLLATEHDAVVFHELPLLRGVGKADVALVNGSLSGYEIKSERDNLDRLPLQIKTYDSVFDYSSVVIAKKHLARARELIPSHWGVVVALQENESIAIDRVRKPKRNQPDREALLGLLWRSELCRVLISLGRPVSHNTLVSSLWNEAREYLSCDDLAEAVRASLKQRSTRSR